MVWFVCKGILLKEKMPFVDIRLCMEYILAGQSYAETVQGLIIENSLIQNNKIQSPIKIRRFCTSFDYTDL